MKKEIIEACEKENTNYMNEIRKNNNILLQLDEYFLNYLQLKEDGNQKEQEYIKHLKNNINSLEYLIECYIKELDQKHYKKIEEIKNN